MVYLVTLPAMDPTADNVHCDSLLTIAIICNRYQAGLVALADDRDGHQRVAVDVDRGQVHRTGRLMRYTKESPGTEFSTMATQRSRRS